VQSDKHISTRIAVPLPVCALADGGSAALPTKRRHEEPSHEELIGQGSSVFNVHVSQWKAKRMVSSASKHPSTAMRYKDAAESPAKRKKVSISGGRHSQETGLEVQFIARRSLAGNADNNIDDKVEFSSVGNGEKISAMNTVSGEEPARTAALPNCAGRVEATLQQVEDILSDLGVQPEQHVSDSYKAVNLEPEFQRPQLQQEAAEENEKGMPFVICSRTNTDQHILEDIEMFDKMRCPDEDFQCPAESVVIPESLPAKDAHPHEGQAHPQVPDSNLVRNFRSLSVAELDPPTSVLPDPHSSVSIPRNTPSPPLLLRTSQTSPQPARPRSRPSIASRHHPTSPPSPPQFPLTPSSLAASAEPEPDDTADGRLQSLEYESPQPRAQPPLPAPAPAPEPASLPTRADTSTDTDLGALPSPLAAFLATLRPLPSLDRAALGATLAAWGFRTSASLDGLARVCTRPGVWVGRDEELRRRFGTLGFMVLCDALQRRAGVRR
jgi:hypothetical protein